LKKDVRHKPIIKGILKEALFLDLEIQVTAGGQVFHGRIVELGDKESEALLLHLDMEDALPNEVTGDVRFSIFFKNFKTNATAGVGFYRPPFLMLGQPDVMLISNERQEVRIYLEDESSSWTRVYLENDEGSVLAQFRPTNLSRNGIGGELVFPSGYVLTPGTRVKGSHWYNQQWIQITGAVRTTRQLTTMHDQTTFCIIGIESESTNGPVATHKTRASRVISDMELEFQFVLNQNKTYRFKITNASVSGFLAELKDVDAQSYVLASKLVRRADSTLCAQLVSYDEGGFRFQWVEGENKDRLKWIKEISKFYGTGIDPVNLRHDDVLSLFCQSGALSDNFIKEQRTLSKQTLKSMARSGNDESWMFRWTNRSAEGKARGYVSSMKSGDNSWSLVDAVSDRHDEKIDPEFLPQFFVAFMEFSLHLTPCPRHFQAWVQGHKFFDGFERYLEGEGKAFVLGKCRMHYTRLSNQVHRAAGMLFEERRVRSVDFSLIYEIRNQLAQANLLEFAEVMDFNINSFSSPSLAGEFRKAHLPFNRESWAFYRDGKIVCLCVLTLVPEGLNPGRWVDSIYLFDLGVAPLDADSWTSLKAQVLALAGRNGYSTHAIRRLEARDVGLSYPNEVALLMSTVLHPAAWAYFKKFLFKEVA
jgi:hypothetical protein